MLLQHENEQKSWEFSQLGKSLNESNSLLRKVEDENSNLKAVLHQSQQNENWMKYDLD